jgi:hypothetical protein
MDETGQRVGQLFLRTPDSKVYGPVDMVTLCAWATDARIIPGCSLSGDKKDWRAVETFPELRLNWRVRLPDGTSYGPLNLLAIWALSQEKSIPGGSTLSDGVTQREAKLDESLHPLLIGESRKMLASAAQLASAILEAFEAGHQGREAELSSCQQQLVVLQGKVDSLESDLAINTKLLAASQRFLAGEGKDSGIGGEYLAERDRLRAERDNALSAVKALELRHTNVEKHLADRSAELEAALGREKILAAQLGEATARYQELDVRLQHSQQETERVRAELKGASEREKTLKGQLSERTSNQQEMALRVECAEKEACTANAKLLDVREREEELTRLLGSMESSLQSETVRLTAALESEKAAHGLTEREKDAVIAALKGELEQWETKFKSALEGVLKMESSLRERDEALTECRHQAERTEAELSSKAAAARKDAEQAHRRAQEWKELCERAQHETSDVREKGNRIAQELREELLAVQRDFGSMQVADGSRPHEPGEGCGTETRAINWLHNERGRSSRPAGASAADQPDALNQRLQESIQEKEALRLTVKRLRSEHEDYERDMQAKLAQLQQDARTSSGLVQQALEELERREAHIRAVRKKAEEREQELLARIDLLERTERESLIVEPEVIAPGAWTPPGSDDGRADASREEPPGREPGMLTQVEAQLRSELKKWETLDRRRGGKSGGIKQWFRRNAS